MSNTSKISIAFVLIINALILPHRAQAQFQVNLTGNYLTSAEKGSSFSDGGWGGGATLRYFLSPKFAVGLNGRYFSGKESTSFDPGTGTGTGSAAFKLSVNYLIVTGQAEYFFTESALRPYVGVEAGLYRTTGKLEITDGYSTLVSESASTNNFGVAPKVGLQYAITPAFGVNVDAGYHIIFDEGETSKSLLLGAGVFFTFGQK